MIVSVLIPTYQRSRDLKVCLAACGSQSRPADEIIVIARVGDTDTHALLADEVKNGLPLKTVMIDVPGQVAALNVGLDAATGDVIAITDDDAAPRADWIERIVAHFASDQALGGLGGRDIVHYGDRVLEGTSAVVGRVRWYGRAIGNHHVGVGRAREVEILKGANMSYRRSAVGNLRFDERLRGVGAQVCNDMRFALCVRRSGWKLVYDPLVRVDHYPAVRRDEDGRDAWNAPSQTNAAHNEALALLDYLPPLRRTAFFVWACLIGTRANPGLLQGGRLWLNGTPEPGRRVWASLCGRYQGRRTWRASR